MRKTIYGILALILCCACLAGGLSAAAAEGYQFEKQDGDWRISWDLAEPEGFGSQVSVYRYKQEKKDEKQIRKQMAEVFGNPVLSAKPDRKAHLCPGDHMKYEVRGFISSPAAPSAAEQAAIGLFGQKLNEAGYPCGQPYVCVTAETLRREMNEEFTGGLMDWDSYARMIRCESYDYEVYPEDILAVFAPEIGGIPVVPELIGNTGEFDVPMFALALVHGDTVSYMEYGGYPRITKEQPVKTEPVGWKAAVDSVLEYSYGKFWKAMFNFPAEEFLDIGLNYPWFFETYRPAYDLRTERVAACYYAWKGELRPAWQVCMTVRVNLENDEGLTPAERHRYMPETIRMDWLVDAVTGEIIG